MRAEEKMRTVSWRWRERMGKGGGRRISRFWDLGPVHSEHSQLTSARAWARRLKCAKQSSTQQE